MNNRRSSSFRSRTRPLVRWTFLAVALSLFFTIPSQSQAAGIPAVGFDGVDDLIEIASPPMLGRTFTEEAWILPEAQDDRYHGIVGANATKVENRAPGLWLKGRTMLHAGFGTGKRWVTVSSPPDSITPGQWNHVAATYDGSKYRLYVNGTEAAAVSAKDVPAPLPVRRIGRVDYWFPGAIREVRLWNRALSAEELRRQMTMDLTGAERGLVAYFKLNDGSGNEAKNSGPYGGSGALLNGATWITSSAPLAAELIHPRVIQPPPEAIESFSPTGNNAAPDAPIEITLRESSEKIDQGSIKLTLDKTPIPSLVTLTDGGALLIRSEQHELLDSASTHIVKLSYISKSPTMKTNEFSYEFSVSSNIILSK